MLEYQDNYLQLAAAVLEQARKDLEADLKNLSGGGRSSEAYEIKLDNVKRSERQIRSEGCAFYCDFFDNITPESIIKTAYENVDEWNRRREERSNENKNKRLQKRLSPE